MKKKYLSIVNYYEDCFEKFGDSIKGVGWNDESASQVRHQVMSELMRKDTSEEITLLDFGCGLSDYYLFLNKNKYYHIVYSGLDISPKFIQSSQTKYPQNSYYCLDILAGPFKLPQFNYIVMNGVFTQKRDLSFTDMFFYLRKTLKKIFPYATKGMAFNIMSPFVDWENPGNFYLPIQKLSRFLVKELSRNIVIRHDYGLYEYTAYVYK